MGFEVGQQFAPVAYHLEQTMPGVKILGMGFEMLG